MDTSDSKDLERERIKAIVMKALEGQEKQRDLLNLDGDLQSLIVAARSEA